MTSLQRHAVLGGALGLILLLLAACGLSSGAYTASQTSTTQTSTSQTATSQPPTSQTSTAGPATDCGRVAGSGAVQGGGSDASTAEACFVTAYAHCSPATLVYTQFGVDAGVIHTLRIARGAGGCLVTDDAQRYIVPQRGTSKPAVHFTCAAVESFDGGIRIRQCGAEGDVVIPS